ncbi:hypothetical protein E1H18_3903 [Caulobacter sp. RHG1]|nr:hypothetical protein [Caulobacter sp. RHG1]
MNWREADVMSMKRRKPLLARSGFQKSQSPTKKEKGYA